MTRIALQLDLAYQIDAQGADFIFNVHAAQTAGQSVSNERLWVNQSVATVVHTDPFSGTRFLRLRADPGDLRVSYSATVDIHHHFADPATLAEVPVCELPPEVFPYLVPSRYCQSDRLGRLAMIEFGSLWPGYSRVLAIQHWVQRHVSFRSNTTDSATSATDTLVERAGVCRDFAHLMIALCRALNIPARFATGTDYGADPSRGPPDFHAYVEAFLGGRWYLFDPAGTAIPMGLVRFGTGRDAADVAFATIFGSVQSQAPMIQTHAVPDAAGMLVYPRHCSEAISTDAGGHASHAP